MLETGTNAVGWSIFTLDFNMGHRGAQVNHQQPTGKGYTFVKAAFLCSTSGSPHDTAAPPFCAAQCCGRTRRDCSERKRARCDTWLANNSGNNQGYCANKGFRSCRRDCLETLTHRQKLIYKNCYTRKCDLTPDPVVRQPFCLPSVTSLLHSPF